MLPIKMGCSHSSHEELRAIGPYKLNKTRLKSTAFIEYQRYKPGPALAIESKKGFSCFNSKFSSSNFSP